MDEEKKKLNTEEKEFKDLLLELGLEISDDKVLKYMEMFDCTNQQLRNYVNMGFKFIDLDNKGNTKHDKITDLKAVYDKHKDEVPLSIYEKTLDSECGGLYPGINVIVGNTGSGKSMWANNIAYHSVKDGKNVLIISLEISNYEILYQMVSIDAFHGFKEEISHSDIKRKELKEKELNHALVDVFNNFMSYEGNLYVVDEWELNVSSHLCFQEKLMEIETLAFEESGRGLDLIIIDYIQLFKKIEEVYKKVNFEVLEVWVNLIRRISNRYLGRDKKIPILVVSQTNREGIARTSGEYLKSVDKRNQYNAENSMISNPNKKKYASRIDNSFNLTHIAGSLEICKAAVTVYTIYTTPTLEASSQCKVGCLKSRNGKGLLEPLIDYANKKYSIIGTGGKGSEGAGGSVFLGYADYNLSDVIGSGSGSGSSGQAIEEFKAFTDDSFENSLLFKDIMNL